MLAVPAPGTLRQRFRVLATALTIAFLITAYFVATSSQAAHAAGTLLSQGQPATASSTENAGTPASLAVDGNTGTRWSSAFSDPQWLQVDLGATDTISSVVLNWEAAYATGFQIQTSTDGTTWTNIYSTTTGTGGIQTLTVSGSGRYVRMNGTARATGYGYSLWEFQVFGTAGGGGGSGCNTTTNAALNKPATASSIENAGTPAASAFDGNTGTRWSSAASDPQWLEVDLGSTQSICQIGLNWETAYASSFQIQTSNDNATWTSIFTTTTGPGGVQTLAVTGSGRYVRMFGTVRHTQYGYSLWEFGVYLGTGTGGGTDTTPPSTPANLTAGATTSSTVPLSWSASTDNVGVTGYQVFRGGALVTTVAGTSYTDTGRAASTTYSYTVKAIDAANNVSAASNTATATTTGTVTVPVGGALGPNVIVYDPSMSSASIQSSVDAIFNTQQSNQFGTQRYAELFKPGSYSGFNDQIGFYTSVMGLGLNPDSTQIHGDITVDAGWSAGNATQNFWRSAGNLEVFPSAGFTRWAVAQAGPFRRMDIQGDLNLAPNGFGFASGGYISDSRITGTVQPYSQQQFFIRNSNIGGYLNGVWNMTNQGVVGAPAQSFPSPPYTTIPTTPVSIDEPYLYLDAAGNYNVFVPSKQANTSGASWIGGNTPGRSIPWNQFYVAHPGDSEANINAALAQGLNLFFTPGVYNISQTINVAHADTVVMGIGFPTLIPQNGIDTMHVADVNGVRLSGILFDAGLTNSNALLTLGTTGSAVDHSADPSTIQDIFFRVGGDIAGKATNSLIVNQNNSIIDHIWAWRADHGSGVGWGTNTADNGLTVNGNNVNAYGIFVEHYQKTEVQWNGNNGYFSFFQNELPYDPPSAAAWMNGSQVGFPAITVASTVTNFTGYGWGSYCFFNVTPSITAYHSFSVPTGAGIHLHDLLTVSLGGVGNIQHVVNDTGAQTPTNTTPVDIVSFP